jgi:hypothetical protein
VPDERPFAHEGSLEELVDRQARGAGREHDERDFEPHVSVEEWQREHERVPDDAVPQAARGLEKHANARVRHPAIQPAADSIFSSVEARQQ